MHRRWVVGLASVPSPDGAARKYGPVKTPGNGCSLPPAACPPAGQRSPLGAHEIYDYFRRDRAGIVRFSELLLRPRPLEKGAFGGNCSKNPPRRRELAHPPGRREGSYSFFPAKKQRWKETATVSPQPGRSPSFSSPSSVGYVVLKSTTPSVRVVAPQLWAILYPPSGRVSARKARNKKVGGKTVASRRHRRKRRSNGRGV